MQCGVWVREHDFPRGNIKTLQSLSPSKLGSLQLKKDMPGHLRKIAGTNLINHILSSLINLQQYSLDINFSFHFGHTMSFSFYFLTIFFFWIKWQLFFKFISLHFIFIYPYYIFLFPPKHYLYYINYYIIYLNVPNTNESLYRNGGSNN